LVVAVVGGLGAGGDDQGVVLEPRAVGENQHPLFRVDIDSLAQQDVRVLVPVQHLPDGRRDIGRRERAGGDLIKQGLKEMEVAAVEQGHFDRRASERAGGVEPAESPSENDYPVADDFSIANTPGRGPW